MDKTVTFAVAGSGKTRSIVEQIDPSRRSLVITYTTNTEDDLRRRIANRLDGRDASVTVDTYFSFLNRFCYKPLLQQDMQSRGISFSAPSQTSSRMPLSSRLRYMHGDRVYHCRMAKLLAVKGCLGDVRERLDRYYDDAAVMVLDTKWKRLEADNRANNYGLAQGDFYQMLAYGQRYLTGQGKLALIYPAWTGFDVPLPMFEMGPGLRMEVLRFDVENDKLCVSDSFWHQSPVIEVVSS